ncbi:MAG: DegV family protein [Anaerolineaceae bacterium]|jgi:DegV family protein with EDD domain|nr:DegV family protein [Anaerolineaceae bacterium]MDD4043103.1 DegV family protein [Anaerolineaceae bacterium]MDD4576979.1 DegV family protein [Anaerolineaceae bacterium]
MKKVAIVSDSSAYIPREYVEQYNLSIVPLTVNWKGETYYDGIDIQATDFYQQLAESKEMATTSQVTVGQFLEVFQKLLSEGKDVLYLGISKGLSATTDSAIQAKKELGDPQNLIVMDTKLVSMALTLQVLEVARAAEKGITLEECYQLAQDAYSRIGVYFTVNTLEYLHRGGRINTAKRMLGSALNLKPIMMIREGKIELVESVRSYKKALARMVELIEKDIDGRGPVRIGPFHALAFDEMVAMEEMAVERLQPIEVIRSEVSPVIGSHVGPGTVSLAYIIDKQS